MNAPCACGLLSYSADVILVWQYTESVVRLLFWAATAPTPSCC